MRLNSKDSIAAPKQATRIGEITIAATKDISGMKLKDALWLWEKKGLIVKCSGKGKVIRQSILQGQYIQRGQQISIELN